MASKRRKEGMQKGGAKQRKISVRVCLMKLGVELAGDGFFTGLSSGAF
jgi:hypothetical protein